MPDVVNELRLRHDPVVVLYEIGEDRKDLWLHRAEHAVSSQLEEVGLQLELVEAVVRHVWILALNAFADKRAGAAVLHGISI
jgi:hypothetical protein